MAKFSELKQASNENKMPFTKDEDIRLVQAVEIHGMNWMKIAEFFDNRGAIKLKNRYYGHIKRKNLLESLKEESSRVKGLGLSDIPSTESF